MKHISKIIISSMTLLVLFQQGHIKDMKNNKTDPIIKTIVVEKIVIQEPEDTVQSAINKAAELIGVNPKFVEAQWRLETGNFKSRRFINNNNFAGIAVYSDKVEGSKYINYEHCAYDYARIIRSRYPNVLCSQNIDEFINGLQDGKYKWAMDKEYKLLVKAKYNNLKER